MEQANQPALTPPEILRAAYQAETSGQVAYAAQFFQHLVDYYGRTPEAAEAGVALRRLGQAPGAAMAASAGKPLSEALASQPTGRPAYAAPPFSSRHAPAARPQASREAIRQPRHAQRRAVAIPQPVRGYKVGRSLAVLTIAAGWLMLAIAIGLAGVNIAIAIGVVRIGTLPPALRETLPVLIALLPVSALLLLLGQVCLAIFRTANATAELVYALHGHADEDDEHS